MSEAAHTGDHIIALPAPFAAAPEGPRKKIAILGTTPTRMDAPIDDKSWEIWTIGPGGMNAHRWDRLFEIHSTWPANFGERPDPDNGGTSYLNDLSLVKRPQVVYSVLPMPVAMEVWAARHGKDKDWLKTHITGDWDANTVIDRASLFEIHGTSFFTSSISFAMALAIGERASDIGVFGIDLESGEEYIAQKPGCLHFIRVARLLGINIHLPKGSGLLVEPSPYPDKNESYLGNLLERKLGWLNATLNQQRQEHAECAMMMHRVEGALFKMRQTNEKEPTEEASKEIEQGEKELAEWSRKLGQVSANMNHCQGEISGLNFVTRMVVYGSVDPGYDLSARSAG